VRRRPLPLSRNSATFDQDNLIHGYSRAEAIADGLLIDVSATAREAGIRYPVALTQAVWERCVAVPPATHPTSAGH
jgi:hypothetical protein